MTTNIITSKSIPTACLLTGERHYKIINIIKLFNLLLLNLFNIIKIWIINIVLLFEYCNIFLFKIGVNLPDHESLFGLLAISLEESQTSVVVVTLFSEHFTSVKNAVTSMVLQLLNQNNDESDVRQCLTISNYFIKQHTWYTNLLTF